MFFRKKSKAEVNTDRIDSLIGETTEITGNVLFKGGLRLDGHVIGNISAQQDEQAVLMIGSNGTVDGDINVTHLIVEGTIRGTVYTENGAELGASSKVEGNIYYGSLEIHTGAVFEGHMVKHQNRVVPEKNATNPASWVSAPAVAPTESGIE